MDRREMLNLIKRADKEYYLNDTPIMTDAEYDKLRYDFIEKFGEVELNYIPGYVKKGLVPFRHPVAIDSLDKVKSEECDKLEKQITKLLPVCVQRKYDGLTLVIYGDKVVTRGNGFEGEIVNNFLSKYDLSDNFSEYPVRGELIMTYSAFERINKQRESAGLPKYKNPRNASAGIIRSINRSPYLDELEFYAYDLIECDLSVTDKMAYIANSTPFKIADTATFDTAKEAIDYINEYYPIYSVQDIPIDGMVVKCNEEYSRQKFGSTLHHPLDAFAWKPFQDGVETILRDVKWQVGKNQITAVAYFDTIEIDGTDVSQASLSNIGIIRKLGLTIGAKILVNKSNQIIPQIVQVLADGDTPINPPTHCPHCGHEITIYNNVVYCMNKNCGARLLNRVAYIASKKILNIKGLSKATIEKLIDNGTIKEQNDLFTVGYGELVNLEGFADKSAKTISTAIANARKNVDLAHFISACCIANVGLEVGNTLMKYFKSSDKLVHALNDFYYDFSKLDGIGDVLSNTLNSDEFKLAYNNLLDYITPEIYEEKEIVGKSYTFVITGKLSKPRDYYKKLIEEKGGKVTGSVSKNTDYLLCEDENSQSSKAIKARALGVTVISEEGLLQIL